MAPETKRRMRQQAPTVGEGTTLSRVRPCRLAKDRPRDTTGPVIDRRNGSAIRFRGHVRIRPHESMRFVGGNGSSNEAWRQAHGSEEAVARFDTSLEIAFDIVGLL